MKRVGPRDDAEDVEVWSTIRGGASSSDEPLLVSLRPSGFDSYIGQRDVKENLLIACQAARRRGESLDHVLLHGPPGLGKTSLARILASELGVGFKSTSGPVIERAGDLAAILTSLEPHDVLFIDEIHRIPRMIEEVLYPAMEDFQLDIVIGQGPAARSVKVDLKPFTLVAATTRTGLLTSPLRDRFGMAFRLNFYKPDELAEIVRNSAKVLKVPIEQDASLELGRRARGTPRIANRLLKRARDYAQECGDGTVSPEIVGVAMERLAVDSSGLDAMDRSILTIIIERYGGGPVGLESIAAALGEDKDTLEDVYEPYLVQEGFIARTRRGREATDVAYRHLGRRPPVRAEQVSEPMSFFDLPELGPVEVGFDDGRDE
jgi:Holliday junction DNA helicase RuvB